MRHPLIALGSFLLCAVVILAGSTGQRPAPRPLVLDGPSASFRVATEYSRTDLRIRMTLSWSKPGKVLDTVGIAGAPVGSFWVSVGPDGRLSVGQYDPGRSSAVRDVNGWHVLLSRTALQPGRPYGVVLELGGRRSAIRVEGQEEAAVELGTPLSGAAIFAGDYPGDDSLGARFNTHPAMTGSITLHYLGAAAGDGVSEEAPLTAVGRAVVDETRQISEADLAGVIGALRNLREKQGLVLGVVFAAPIGAEAAPARARRYRDEMIARNVLPEESGLMLCTPGAQAWSRSRGMDARLPLDTVRRALAASAPGVPLVARVTRALVLLAEGMGNAPEPVRVGESVRGEIGPQGGVIRLGDGTRLVFPAGSVPEAMTVTLQRVEPGGRVPTYEGVEQIVLECGAPVREFRKEVELRVPLPAEFAGEHADTVVAGFLDPETGAVRVDGFTVEVQDGKPEVVLPTRHFSTAVVTRPKFPGRQTARGAVLHVPYYNQPDVVGAQAGFCFGAALQMICEAVHPTPAPERTVYNVIGQVGASAAKGFSAFSARTSQRLTQLIERRTGKQPERTLWYGSARVLTTRRPEDSLVGYLRSRIDLGYPVYLNGYRKDLENPASPELIPHAVVVVGYQANPGASRPHHFYVHDPTALGPQHAYQLRSIADLGLDIWNITYPFATIVVPAPATVNRLASLNLRDETIQFVRKTPPGRRYYFQWDHAQGQGYSYMSHGGAGVTPTAVPRIIPADVEELWVGPQSRSIQVTSGHPTGTARVSVWYEVGSTRSGARKYVSPPVVVDLPARGLQPVNFAPIGVDEFRDSVPDVAYELRVIAADGGRVVDMAGVEFVLGEPAPEIQSVTPLSGLVGSPLRLQGRHFGASHREGTLTLKGQLVTAVRSWSDTVVEAEVPAGATTGDLVVTRAGRKSNGVRFEVGAGGPQPVFFTAQRMLASPLGKSKQQCLDYTLKVFQAGRQVWSGVSEQATATNGLLSTTLAPGEYQLELQYRYRRPVEEGTRAAKFTVTPGGAEVVVDTETGVATVRPRGRAVVKPDDPKDRDTLKAVALAGTRPFNQMLLFRTTAGGKEESAGGTSLATGTVTFSGQAAAHVRAGAGSVLQYPRLVAAQGTGFRIGIPRGENPPDDWADVSGTGECALDRSAVARDTDDGREDWAFRAKGFKIRTSKAELRDGRLEQRVETRDVGAGKISERVHPGSEHGSSVELYCVFEVEVRLRPRGGGAPVSRMLRGEVLVGSVHVSNL